MRFIYNANGGRRVYILEHVRNVSPTDMHVRVIGYIKKDSGAPPIGMEVTIGKDSVEPYHQYNESYVSLLNKEV